MINKTHKVLTIAFVIICIFPFNVLAQDKMDSKLDCEPLPEAERFKALGYELGTCKSDVEELIKKHGGSTELISYGYASASDIIPKHLTAYESNYIGAVFPFKDKLLSEPHLFLRFYNDVLVGIKVFFLYTPIGWKVGQLESMVRDAFNILETKISKRVGKGTIVKTKNISRPEVLIESWFTDSTRIDLDFNQDTFFEVSYENTKLTNLANQDISEYTKQVKKKEFQKQLDAVEGF